MTNDESKMTKEIRMTNDDRAGFGEVHQATVGGGRRGGGFFWPSDLVIPSSFGIRHSLFCLLKA